MEEYIRKKIPFPKFHEAVKGKHILNGKKERYPFQVYHSDMSDEALLLFMKGEHPHFTLSDKRFWKDGRFLLKLGRTKDLSYINTDEQ